MTAAPDPLALAGEFVPATEDEWRALVAGVLERSGGAVEDPIEALSSTSYDGIRVRPLYPGPADRAAPVARPGTDGWDVRAWHRDPDPARTRAAALADLEGGATSLWLQLGDGGLAVADLPGALADVYVDLAPIALDAGAETGAAARAFVELVRSRGLEPATVAGTLGADPIGLRARTGAAAELGQLAELAELARPYSNLHVATVDATGYHEAGASDADELAIATAVGVAYLRALTDAGLSPAEAFAALGFRFAVTADQFLSLAKLRAARRIWARVATLSDADGVAQHQHAVTSAAMMTRRDPWVNLLRTTVAGFAAAVAGADAVTVLPFDNALGLPDDFARRLARNTQAILHDESSLGRVADAAGGSGYVEALTEALATRAWDGFTAIERDGGALAALDDGRIAALAAATRERRAQDIAHRRFAITGVSQFALPDEAPLPRRAAPPTPHGGPLAPTRYAEEFEALRDRAEASDPRPAVFLAALGPFATHSARVDFAANLFNAGGLRVVVGPPDDFADSGARVVCLCGSDESYHAEAADLAGALRAAGAAHIWQAGSTAVAGVDDVITAGSDALAVLRTTLEVATA